MTPIETATLLRQFNDWRRGDEDIPQFDPREIGEAIDAAVEMIERLEAAEKERDEFKRACFGHISDNSMLRAKIEQMERQEPLYLFRRRGLDDFCTCSKERYEAFSANPRLFEVKMLYGLPGAQPAPSVPDGWKLVPTEPTKEMRAAWDSSPICEDDDAEFRRAYSEMLEAAPEAKPCP